MMSQHDRDGYLDLLSEVQHAIESGESATRETRQRLEGLAESIDTVNREAIVTAQMLMHASGVSVAIDGRWHRSTAFKYMRTPLGTDGSRIHPARYHGPLSAGALYITESASTAAAERRNSVHSEIFTTFPIDAKFHRILDLSTKEACMRAGVSQPLLGLEWQFIHDILGKLPYTQLIGDLARQNLFEGILYESVRVKGTRNLVIFPETMQVESYVSVVDTQHLLDAHGCEPDALSIRGVVPKIDD